MAKAKKVENKHKVPRDQWRKWDEPARETFNHLFSLMLNRTRLFMHPKATLPPKEHRKTTAWNAAWLAADAVRDARA